MNVSDILGIAGVVVGIAGLLYAIYQGSERRKLRDYVRSQNWHLYSKANNSNGSLQLALATYKKIAKGQIDPEVLELLGRADAFAQDVFKDVIRQIQIAEPDFTRETITQWVEEERINEGHAKLFLNLTPTSPRRKKDANAATLAH